MADLFDHRPPRPLGGRAETEPMAQGTTVEEWARESPGCVPLEAVAGELAGGKARGLAFLMKLGLAVPPGFVVVNARPGRLPPDLERSYRRLGEGAVAVRSSALGEDSSEASFAGQYSTVLNVRGMTDLRDAVERCLASAESIDAATYRERQTDLERVAMSVVVQRMVDVRAAGVLFTVDPVTGRRNRMVVDAIDGPGELLVGGLVTPDHYLVDRRGAVASAQLRGDQPLLDEADLRRLAEDAARAEREHGVPLDMEWAISEAGELYWLQARPVTALPPDPNELDVLQDEADHCTSCNIGECMPGAITPLSLSTVWKSNDRALQTMHVRCGILDRESRGFLFTRIYFGRLHLNLTRLGKMSTHVAGSTTDRLSLAICGRTIPDLDPGPPASPLLRASNGARYVRYLLGGKEHHRRIERLVRRLTFPDRPTAFATYGEIDRRLPELDAAFDHHMTSSAGSGALEPTLMETVSKGDVSPATHAHVAALLAAASDRDVESADVVAGIDRLVDALLMVASARERFGDASPEEALCWMRSDEAGTAGRELDSYLRRHGHRSIRELELRQKEWSADPMGLVVSLQAAYRARLALGDRASPRRRDVEGAASIELSRGMRWLVEVTQSAVRRRERTKSLLVLVVTRFKRAYRRLGELLEREGKLPDADAVFFLTHEELGALCRGQGAELADRAVGRRTAMDYQREVVLPDVFTGWPEPVEWAGRGGEGGVELQGKPVSRGVARGPARVARTVDEAAALRPGEILIAPVTDVGWSPYFSMISGLATDVGSSVSHGAVVAREYGLPAVVDLRRATKTFETGDRVVLDGDRGVLRLDDSEEEG